MSGEEGFEGEGGHGPFDMEWSGCEGCEIGIERLVVWVRLGDVNEVRVCLCRILEATV